MPGANRCLAAVGAVLVGFFVVYPTLLVVDYLAKPRASIDQAALGLAHERVAFPASDGVRLAGWYVRSRNGAAIVLVHGGGGDRQGTIRHARMLAKAGYGVLLYDARGRGESAGHENAFGWQWDRDVRGAVSYLTRRGIQPHRPARHLHRRRSSRHRGSIRPPRQSRRLGRPSGPDCRRRQPSPFRRPNLASRFRLPSRAPRSSSPPAKRNPRPLDDSSCTRSRARGRCC